MLGRVLEYHGAVLFLLSPQHRRPFARGAVGVEPETWCVGKSKLFLKVGVLDKVRRAAVGPLSIILGGVPCRLFFDALVSC